MKTPKFAAISPCKNEERYLRRSLSSVANQTVRPSIWIIVDDGSDDGSYQMLQEFEEQHPDWVRIVRSDSGSARVLGSGVVHAFNVGLRELDLSEYTYVCKLDVDLILPPRYFETALRELEAQPRLASFSGKPYYIDRSGERRWEPCGDENSVGMVKLYRVTAFLEIGGLVPALMWDGIDCVEARRVGWEVGSRSGADLDFQHLRAMGSSDRGVLRGRRRHGYGQYFMGTNCLYLLASCAYRLLKPPAVLGSLSIFIGYIHAALSRTSRYGSKEYRSDLQRFQLEVLVFGKTNAVRRWSARTAGVWKARHEGHGF